VEKLIMKNRIIKVLEIARTMKISCGSVETIIHDHVKMSQLSLWLPRSLTAQDRAYRVMASQEFLDLFASNHGKFVQHIVTEMNSGFTIGTQKVNRSRCSGDMLHSPPPKKFIIQPSAGKIMATIYLDSKGVLLIN